MDSHTKSYKSPDPRIPIPSLINQPIQKVPYKGPGGGGGVLRGKKDRDDHRKS